MEVADFLNPLHSDWVGLTPLSAFSLYPRQLPPRHRGPEQQALPLLHMQDPVNKFTSSFIRSRRKKKDFRIISFSVDPTRACFYCQIKRKFVRNDLEISLWLDRTVYLIPVPIFILIPAFLLPFGSSPVLVVITFLAVGIPIWDVVWGRRSGMTFICLRKISNKKNLLNYNLLSLTRTFKFWEKILFKF